jgi:serine/threonine protein kinase
VLHRDIKLDNILLTSEGNIKICDFGVSKLTRAGETMKEQCGTPAYIAPEVFEGNGYEGYASDVWSSGVVLYAMLYGTVPFKASNMTELQRQICKGTTTFKDEISAESINLLQAILEKDPKKRISIDQILRHPWMQNIPKFSKHQSINLSYSKRLHGPREGEDGLRLCLL